MNKIIVNFGGGYYSLRTESERRQALGLSACLRRLPVKGGQRHKLIVGGDSYGC